MANVLTHLPKTWVLHRKISGQGADHHSLSSNLSAVDDVPLRSSDGEPLGVVFNLHWLVLWNMISMTFQKIVKITLTDFHIFQRVETTNQSKSELGFQKKVGNGYVSHSIDESKIACSGQHLGLTA